MDFDTGFRLHVKWGHSRPPTTLCISVSLETGMAQVHHLLKSLIRDTVWSKFVFVRVYIHETKVAVPSWWQYSIPPYSMQATFRGLAILFDAGGVQCIAGTISLKH